MKKIFLSALSAILATGVSYSQWIPSAPGSYDYATTSNWGGSSITGDFTFPWTGSPGVMEVCFDSPAGVPLTLATGLNFNLSGYETDGPRNLFFAGTFNPVTLALTGDITNKTALPAGSTILFGTNTDNAGLTVDFGASPRTVSSASANGFAFVNSITGSNNITFSGGGLTGFEADNSGFTGNIIVSGATVALRAQGAFREAGMINLTGTASSPAKLVLDNDNASWSGVAKTSIYDRIGSVPIVTNGNAAIIYRVDDPVGGFQVIPSIQVDSGQTVIQLTGDWDRTGAIWPPPGITEACGIAIGNIEMAPGTSLVVGNYFDNGYKNLKSLLGQVEDESVAYRSTTIKTATINGADPSQSLVNGILPFVVVGNYTDRKSVV